MAGSIPSDAEKRSAPPPEEVAVVQSAEACVAPESRSLLLDLPGPALHLVLRHAREDGTPGSCFLAPICSSLRAAARQLSSKLVVHLHINELLEESHWRIQTIRATTPTLLYQPALAAAADALEEAKEQHQLQEAAAYAKATSLGAWLLQYVGCVECLRVTIACSQGFLPTRRLELPILQALQAAAAAAAAAAADSGLARAEVTAAAATAAAAAAAAGAAAAGVAGSRTSAAAGSSAGLPLRRLQLPPLLTTPAAAQALACCRQLQELSLTLHFTDNSSSIAPSTPGSSSSSTTSSTGAWCDALQQLSGLQKAALVIGRQPRHTQQLEQLVAHLPAALQALDLTYPSSVQLSSSTITHLSALRTLRLSGVQFKHGTPQQLGRLTALTAVEHGQINAEPCDTLQAPGLVDLYVTTVSTSCLQQLRGASSLLGLHVALALPKHPGVLGALRPLQQLRRLRLGKLLRWRSDEVAAQGWGEALAGLSQLQELQLPQRLLLASRARDWLPGMQKLQQLEVSYYDVEQVQQEAAEAYDNGSIGPAAATAVAHAREMMQRRTAANSDGGLQRCWLTIAAALQEVAASKVQLQSLVFTSFRDEWVHSVEAALSAACPGVQCRCVPRDAVVSPCQVLLE